MDAAYEHISEEEPTHHSGSTSQGASNNTEAEPPITLTTEFQQAYQAVVSSSPWGAKLGGFFGQVKKQSESLYSDAQKEYASRSEKATKGLSGLLEQTRNISLAPPIAATGTAVSFSDPTFTLPEPDPETSSSTPTLKAKEKTVLPQEEPSSSSSSSSDHHPTTTERPDSLPADIVKEATNLVSRFRTQQAPSLLKRVQKAEDAADEALLKFGTNMKNWLRDAVTVTGPDSSSSIDNKYGDESTTELLFETNDAEGKRVFHSSRFEAQLHVIHSTPSSFLQDSDSGEYAGFEKEFDVERQTEEIAKDLDKYEELRRAMEKLVPEKVDYVTFWRRYYFLRKVVGEEERRRKEVLKGAAAEDDAQLGWGSDDDDDSDNEQDEDATTPHAARSSSTLTAATTQNQTTKANTNTLLKPRSPRRSDEDMKSVADSDASYDIVSGATSRAPGSPKEEKKDPVTEAVKEEESDEEDWE